MTTRKEIRIPDLGGADEVDVIEIFVSSGEQVEVEGSLLTLESEKASMEIPSPYEGKIVDVKIKIGDKISEGDLFCYVEVEDTAGNESENKKEKAEEKTAKSVNEVVTQITERVQVHVPDLGGAEDVDLIEVCVAEGDEIDVEDPLIILESEKASMEIPSPYAGVVKKVSIAVGDKVSQDDLILEMVVKHQEAEEEVEEEAEEKETAPAAKKADQDKVVSITKQSVKEKEVIAAKPGENVYSSPSVRRLARELGVDLSKVIGSGQRGRILSEDVKKFVKSSQKKNGQGNGLGVIDAPKIDHAKFGEVEQQALSKIKKFSGANLHRNWVTVPHITQFDEADITELEAFRQEHKKEAQSQGFKLTPLVFIMKAVVATLQQFPQFNSSLDPSGEFLIMKKYYHIGVAVDTPEGLVVPVVKDVDKKGLFELAKELGEISVKARDKKLLVKEMQGSCMTISSLGGIGGTAFTPIVNVPDVAILGVSKSSMKPVYVDGKFEPRLMLPLSLSYDHRVIDGADGARFSSYLVKMLTDLRNYLL